MAPGQRFRSEGASGVGGFLASHQECDAGFDVTRDQASRSGRLSITCKGCGRRVEYRAGEAWRMGAGELLSAGNGELAAVASQVAAEGGATAPSPPTAAAAAPRPVGTRPARRSASPAAGRRARVQTPPWLANLLIIATIVVGAALILVGLLRSGDDPEPTGSAAPSSKPAPEPAPSETTPGGSGEGAAPRPAAEPRPASAPPPPELNIRLIADRFLIGIPVGWESGVSGGAVSIRAPGEAAEVRVFFEPGERKPAQMAPGAARFLRSEHPGARVTKPTGSSVAGAPAIRLRATYPGGAESALLLAEGGYTYLVLQRLDDAAGELARRQAAASFDSFRPA